MKALSALITRMLTGVLISGLAFGALPPALHTQFLPVAAQSDTRLHLPLIGKNFTWTDGTVSGFVADAFTGDAIDGAEICIASVGCTTTNAIGWYSFILPQGRVTLHAELTGYYPVDKAAFALAARDIKVNIAMSPLLSSDNVILRFVLTWSVTPTYTNPLPPPPEWENDLDAHLWVMPDNPQFNCHIQPFGDNALDCPLGDMYDCTTNPYACLETEVRLGSGPETISIGEILTGTQTRYYYGVFNYNQYQPGVPQLSSTGAHVDVYNEAGLLYSLDPPVGASGNFWYILNVEGLTGIVQPVNCVVNFYAPGTPAFPETPPCQ